MKIVAFGHRKERGKDTAARLLQTILRFDGYDAQLFSFAYRLKQQAYELYKHCGLKEPEYYERNRDARNIPLPGINKTPRQIHIEFGMACRAIYNDTWLLPLREIVAEAKQKPCPKKVVIVTDLRFHNEAQDCQQPVENLYSNQIHGICARVDRLIETSTDEADEALAKWTGWNFILNNNGMIKDLEKELNPIIDWVKTS